MRELPARKANRRLADCVPITRVPPRARARALHRMRQPHPPVSPSPRRIVADETGHYYAANPRLTRAGLIGATATIERGSRNYPRRRGRRRSLRQTRPRHG